MKKVIVQIFLFFLPIIGFSQTNLVPNWSFEDTIQCPMSGGQIDFAKYWFSPSNPSINSSDYLNACSFPYGLNVPFTAYGFQNAKTGKAYAGIILYSNYSSDYREYIETKLPYPLEKDRKYCVEFYINLADTSKYGIDKIGIYFSNDSVKQISLDTICKAPQIINPANNIITDTVNWIRVSGIYLALGGEMFLTIGNFHNDDSTNVTISNIASNIYFAYYYIDDVKVYLCPDTIIPPNHENEIVMVNAFTPNNDGVNDLYNVKGNHIKEIHATVFNRWGQELYNWNEINGGWNGKYKGKEVAAGTYFYVVTVVYEDGKTEERHGAVTLVR
jgi:gliding motility-associated-like protein